MRILALMIITGVILLLLTIVISFGVAVGIILGYKTLRNQNDNNTRDRKKRGNYSGTSK